MIIHNDKLAQLEEDDPRYADCPQFCSRPEADRARGCPDCLVSQMYRELEDEFEQELVEMAHRQGKPQSYRCPWSFKTIRSHVSTISATDSAHGKGTSPRWTVRDRILVSQLRNLNALFNRQRLKRPPKGSDDGR